MSHEDIRFRFDYIQKVTGYDKEKGMFRVDLIPDPRRYEWREENGVKYLFNRFENMRFPLEVLSQFAKQMEGKPIYHERQDIDRAEDYVKERKPFIRQMIKDGGVKEASFEDKSAEFLESLSRDELGFVIMCIDIVGSTKLANTVEPKKYGTLISTVLFELSEVIPKFHGHVLKYTGDGLIAYFPEPSFNRKNDLAIDCALTARGLIYDVINPILIEEQFPSINIRIGLDSGNALIATIGSPETKQHKDLIGDVVNLAAKIQGLAGSGEICLGDHTIKALHTSWRTMCEPVELPKSWPYKGERKQLYKVHRVKPSCVINLCDESHSMS